MQCAPNSVALRTPSHFAAATGGFQRRSPTGGAAYGIPRNACTAPSSFPSTTPEAVFTCGASDAPNRASGKASIPHTTNVLQTIFEFMRSPSTWTMRTANCIGKNHREWVDRSLANLPSRIYNQMHDRSS